MTDEQRQEMSLEEMFRAYFLRKLIERIEEDHVAFLLLDWQWSEK